MTWNEFLQSLKGGALERVYVFAGAEEWLKREALNTLRGKLLPPGLEALNDLTTKVHQSPGETTSLGAAIAAGVGVGLFAVGWYLRFTGKKHE